MMGSWSNESLLVYARTWEGPFTLTGAESYLIGPGQTFNTVKPTVIVSGYVREGGIDNPLTIINDEEYQLIQLKSQDGDAWYLNYDNGHPYGRIRLYPKSSTETLFLLTEKPLTSFASINATVDLPTGWNKALKYNLAIDWAPEFGVSPDPIVIMEANKSKANITRAVIKNRPMTWQSDVPRNRNIYSGWE